METIGPDYLPEMEFTLSYLTRQSPAEFLTPAEECLVPRVAYDIGSSVTKVMGAVVNVCQLTIQETFNIDSFPVLYREDLYRSKNNEFSDLIQTLGLETLSSAKSQMEKQFEHSVAKEKKLQHCAVATAAFRTANNGEDYIAHLSQELAIPVKIISQQEEGELAYYGTLLQLEGSAKPLVWDIGGGSMQLTYKNTEGFVTVGTNLASHTFHQLVLEKICHKAAHESPHPMNYQQVESAIALAKEQLTIDNIGPQLKALLKDATTPVVAVGSVHNYTVQPWCNLLVKESKNFYSKEDIHQVIELLTNKTDAEILGMRQNLQKAFVKDQLTNLILAYAVMDEAGIDQVKTLQTSNMQGLLLKGCEDNSAFRN